MIERKQVLKIHRQFTVMNNKKESQKKHEKIERIHRNDASEKTRAIKL